MKDPCNECLVSIMCSQLCWQKINYGTLLKTSINESKQMINKRTRKNDSYVEEFLKYKLKYEEHRKTFNEVLFKKIRITRGL